MDISIAPGNGAPTDGAFMRLRTASKPILLAALIALCAPTASQAQYFNNSYSLLYPLSYMLRGGGGFGYNSYGNPFYLLNTVGRNSYYSPLGYMPYSNNGGNLNNYNNQNGNGPFGYGQNNNNNQNQNQNNYNPATNTSQLSGQQGNNPYQQYYPQGNSNSNGYGASTYGSNPQPQFVKDQIAHSNHNNQPQASQYQPQATPTTTQNSYPALAPNSHNIAAMSGGSTFANSFLDTLENKYHGNLDVAFRDRDFVSWAQALNIPVKNAHQFAMIGSVRKQAINSVLKDSSLDSGAKVQALKVLLR